MKATHLFIVLLFVGFSLAATSSEYDISGVVTQKKAGPLEGVTVLLKGLNDSTVTGVDGTFKIASPVAVRLRVPKTDAVSFTLRGNTVTFSPTAKKLYGNVKMLSATGQCISATAFSGLNPATQQVTLPQLPSGFNIFRITVNNTVHTCKVIRLGRYIHFVNNTIPTLSVGNLPFAKATVTDAEDTLVARKEGYKEVRMPIESYTISDVSIEMDTVREGSGDIVWGRTENPTAGCTVTGHMPGYNDLTPDSKMPDPFTAMDNTRIMNKSEWACRREEIYRQMLHYIYGNKPVPSEGSVSGTVGTERITVKVSESGKSCSFSVDVKMNGASKPAPAIISYGTMGGVQPPRGVAKITFNAIEEQGGDGPKTGPFFELYGSDHPAGYLTAQAWQVSRIIDVLEQNPGTIDPYHLGVTGCSRWGKGAFVAGVLDNRIALTIPVESGIGGTVGLRLKEQLDPGHNREDEWTFHAISYVRWLSEVALGDFSKGDPNDGWSSNPELDNTDRLPVDMHSAMALIVPRGLFIIDNSNDMYQLDPRSAWVTACIGKKIFEALGVGDHMAYISASVSHCSWSGQYNTILSGMIDKFLKGNSSAQTGEFISALGGSYNPEDYFDWDAGELPGDL